MFTINKKGSISWKKKYHKELAIKIVSYMLLSLGALLMVYPFIWMFNTSLTPLSELWKEKDQWWQYWFPAGFEIENYHRVLTQKYCPLVVLI